MEKIVQSRWFTKVIALIFALLLFFNANSTRPNKQIETGPSLAAVAEKVPINLKYDEKKYFVSGYESTTTVYLKSSNRVLLDSESHDQTRKFTVEADLTRFEEGTYEVPISIQNLNPGVQGTLADRTIHVTLEKRSSKKVSVTPKINDNLLKHGYTLEGIKVTPEVVKVTGGKKTLKKIKRVEATLSDDRDLSENLSKRVDLIAVDEDGNALSVVMTPNTATMTVEISAPTKMVPIKVKRSGTLPNGIKSFEFKPEIKEVRLQGAMETLDKVNEIELSINTSEVTEEFKETYRLPTQAGIEMSPNNVKVKVIPIKESKE
ncbi:CdaR family protein [Vagococcus intermedius]|uniref:CdaR family protein n=1 Tax=Vagococcus intermedius TaxID=2991418 RepID=A0AAF0CTR2_9ENTE|nr:CdaR family protein [Vagococcus intermedius]WEG72800.1 CdaR family protein [Vagococcus intermedius]WEG74885.1 CdaR family protein [Vagococcus intermedius]